MFVKQIGSEKYGVFADEGFRLRVGTAERVQREWYFEATAKYGGKWAFGKTLGDAVGQTCVLEQVHQETRAAGRKGNR
jgi:hypothetical protein